MLQSDDMGIHGIVPWCSGTALDVGRVTAAALARQRHPLRRERRGAPPARTAAPAPGRAHDRPGAAGGADQGQDRKSTRLNSSHTVISYAVFCLKKKKKKERNTTPREVRQ